MRCDLAAALLHRPRILFLDEPTIGLDVVAKENVRRFLKEIRDLQGVTIILTTHDLGDIEQLCSRVMIIDKGRVHFDGELDDLRNRTGHRVRMTVDLRESTTSDRLAEATSGLPVTWQAGEGARHVAEFRRQDVAGAEVIRRLVNDCPVKDLQLAEPDIEEIVRDIYRASARGGAA
jgi:ABC-2 type transport system ATP-binding protein